MKKYEPKDIRNVVLMGHSGSGKTTIADAMLFKSGSGSRQGKVEDGTSVFDYTSEEIKWKISISLGLAWLEWKDEHGSPLLINLIDTPGYDDFRGDVIAGSRVADGCIIVVNAATGIEPGTLKAKELAENLKLPIFIFINQVKKPNVNFDKVLKEIKDLFGRGVTLLAIPQGDKIISILESDSPYKSDSLETIAEVEDSLTEKYLNEEKLEPADIGKGLQIGVRTRKVIPLYSGDAYDNIGVSELLNGLSFLNSPLEREEAKNESLSALNFKTMVDPHLGDLKFVRVFSGALEAGTNVFNSNKGKDEKLNQLYVVRGKEREEVKSLETGMIGALVKLKATKTGDTLTSKGNSVKLDKLEFPMAQIKMAVIPKSKHDEERVSVGLSKLNEEDPTFISFYDAETKQRIISGLGEMHFNVMLDKLKKNFGVEVGTERPRIHYRETITGMAEQQGKYKRQTGGHGQYGDCWVKFEPLERGKGVEFVDAIVGGKIPKRFIPSVEKGIRESVERGILAGYPTTDFKATLYDGSFHDVDSSDIAFKIAASMAFRDGMPRAKPILLEPIMRAEVIAPSEFMGDVMGEISSRRGKIERTEPVGQHQKIYALVPEAELYGFSTSLRSQTQGMASFSQEFLRYEVVPRETQQQIIEEHKKVSTTRKEEK